MTEQDIKTKHGKIHSTLERIFYQEQGKMPNRPKPTAQEISEVEAFLGVTIKNLSKEQFDQIHGKNWDDMRAELIAAGYLKPPVIVKPLEERIAELEAKLIEYENLPSGLKVWGKR